MFVLLPRWARARSIQAPEAPHTKPRVVRSPRARLALIALMALMCLLAACGGGLSSGVTATR
ncbi:MAG TPA: hypothetical protein VJQ45_03710, partial [Ktedonobacterales bacterium]|nr:hypothetical protein [Ktedonobacterales bacterium]